MFMLRLSTKSTFGRCKILKVAFHSDNTKRWKCERARTSKYLQSCIVSKADEDWSKIWLMETWSAPMNFMRHFPPPSKRGDCTNIWESKWKISRKRFLMASCRCGFALDNVSAVISKATVGSVGSSFAFFFFSVLLSFLSFLFCFPSVFESFLVLLILGRSSKFFCEPRSMVGPTCHFHIPSTRLNTSVLDSDKVICTKPLPKSGCLPGQVMATNMHKNTKTLQNGDSLQTCNVPKKLVWRAQIWCEDFTLFTIDFIIAALHSEMRTYPWWNLQPENIQEHPARKSTLPPSPPRPWMLHLPSICCNRSGRWKGWKGPRKYTWTLLAWSGCLCADCMEIEYTREIIKVNERTWDSCAPLLQNVPA